MFTVLAMTHRRFLLFSAIICAYLILVASSFGFEHEPWGDETHFVGTIREFSQSPFLKSIRDYREMTPPLTFVLYSWWSNVLGGSLGSLRILTLLFAAVAHCIFAWLLVREQGGALYAAVALATYLLNPYTIGLSFFVFTDIPMMVCLLIVLWGIQRRHFALVSIAIASGLLFRQYFAFVALSTILLVAAGLRWRGNGWRPVHLAGVFAAFLPLAGMMTMWGGLAPPSGRAYWVREDALGFHADALVLYISLLAAFTFPAALFIRKQFWFRPWEHAILLVASLSFWLFPIRASAESLAGGMATVGLLHRALILILGGGEGAMMAYYVFFLAGLHVLWWTLLSLRTQAMQQNASYAFFLDICVVSFLLVMPWSYQVWEKYAIAAVPILLLRFGLATRTSSEQNGREITWT